MGKLPTKQDLKSIKGKEQDEVVFALTKAIGPDEAIKLVEGMCDQSKHAKRIAPDGTLPKWGEPPVDAMKKTPGQKKKKVSEEVKTIKVGEDAVGSDKCHYALVMDRKVTAVGTKDEMLAKCKEEGGRVWVSTKQVGDIVEAKYAVDIEGMPRFYMDSDSPAKVKLALRQMLKRASAVKSVTRTYDTNIKADLRARLRDASTDMQTNLVHEKLKPSDSMGTYIKDFQDSDAPQFKGKSKEKRRKMAIAAKLSAMEGYVSHAQRKAVWAARNDEKKGLTKKGKKS